MNKNPKKPAKTAAGPCLCQGIGPAMSDFLQRFGPPPEARQHFEAARVEFLKGLRALLDARIEQCSKARTKGEKINVE